ncbi:MAG TPA: hypothetical protein VJR23_15445 [Candidatus Acidoferrales bacterium]|nr:hypothetical protein [Candidatus Acidoferrales bacterium]
MGRFQSLVNKRVEAHYRAGDIQLSAVGTLVTDSGKSIFVEERFSQNGKSKTIRVEVPYEFIIRVVALAENSPAGAAQSGKTRPLAKKHS